LKQEQGRGLLDGISLQKKLILKLVESKFLSQEVLRFIFEIVREKLATGAIKKPVNSAFTGFRLKIALDHSSPWQDNYRTDSLMI
jgi:hypothetical protein